MCDVVAKGSSVQVDGENELDCDHVIVVVLSQDCDTVCWAWHPVIRVETVVPVVGCGVCDEDRRVTETNRVEVRVVWDFAVRVCYRMTV